MYSVSQDYLDALHSEVTRAYLTFTIDGDESIYTEENILQGSFNITNQCTGTGDVELGGVYVGVLNATLRNVAVLRQEWHGKKITPTFHFLVDEEHDTWESVPLGVYSISLADWKNTGVVIRAYDNMSLLDVPYFVSEAEGKLYDFLTLAADACGITLAQTQQEFEQLPNADVTFTFASNTGVETWRDIVSCIAQIIGGFATCNRAGELLFVSYGQTTCDTLDTAQRHTGGNFSDYKTKYTAFSVTFAETKETRTYFQEENDGLTMSIGTNAFLQDETVVNSIAQGLLDAIANVQYVPCKISVASNPVYDLGDVIEFTDGLAGTSSVCCVQKFEFYMHRNLKLSGFGADPNSADAKSKAEKQIVSLQQGLAQTSEQTLDFILPSTLSQSDIVNNSSNNVATFDFTCNIEDSKVDFFMCMQFSAGTLVANNVYSDLTLTVTLTLDGTTIATIIEAYRDGQQVLTINHLLVNVIKGNHTLTVNVAASDGSVTNIQHIASYLLTAKSTGSGSMTEKTLFANGTWAQDVLADGLDANKMTESAMLSGIENSIIKFAKERDKGFANKIADLSQYYGSSYLLLAGNEYCEPFYTVSDYFRKQGTHGAGTSDSGKPIGSTDGGFCIPIKRTTGFTTLTAEMKIVQNNGRTVGYDGNLCRIGVGAIVNDNFVFVATSEYSNVTEWNVKTLDISTLPYIDYIILFGVDGSPAYRNIRLIRSN